MGGSYSDSEDEQVLAMAAGVVRGKLLNMSVRDLSSNSGGVQISGRGSSGSGVAGTEISFLYGLGGCPIMDSSFSTGDWANISGSNRSSSKGSGSRDVSGDDIASKMGSCSSSGFVSSEEESELGMSY